MRQIVAVFAFLALSGCATTPRASVSRIDEVIDLVDADCQRPLAGTGLHLELYQDGDRKDALAMEASGQLRPGLAREDDRALVLQAIAACSASFQRAADARGYTGIVIEPGLNNLKE